MGRKRRGTAWRLAWGAGLAVAVSFAGAACRGPVRPGGGGDARVRVGYIPIADCAQVFVAMKCGYFEREGVSVTPVSLAGGPMILEALGARGVDVAFTNVVSFLLARDAGLPFVAISGGPVEEAGHVEHAILVRGDGPVRVPADLRGRVLAINSRRNIDDLMVRRLLAQAGVDPAEVRFVEVPFPRMLAVLEAGRVDAVAAIEPYVSIGSAGGRTRQLIANYIEVQPVTEISTYVVREDWLEANRDVGARVARALRAAAAHANAQPAEVRAILTRYTALGREQADRMALPRFSARLDVDRLRGMQALMQVEGWVRRDLPLDRIVISPEPTPAW